MRRPDVGGNAPERKPGGRSLAQVIDFMHVPGQRAAGRTLFLWRAGTWSPQIPDTPAAFLRIGKGLTPKETAPAWGQAEAVPIRTPDGRGLVHIRVFPALDTAKYRRFQSSGPWIVPDRTFSWTARYRLPPRPNYAGVPCACAGRPARQPANPKALWTKVVEPIRSPSDPIPLGRDLGGCYVRRTRFQELGWTTSEQGWQRTWSPRVPAPHENRWLLEEARWYGRLGARRLPPGFRG